VQNRTGLQHGPRIDEGGGRQPETQIPPNPTPKGFTSLPNGWVSVTRGMDTEIPHPPVVLAYCNRVDGGSSTRPHFASFLFLCFADTKVQGSRLEAHSSACHVCTRTACMDPFSSSEAFKVG